MTTHCRSNLEKRGETIRDRRFSSQGDMFHCHRDTPCTFETSCMPVLSELSSSAFSLGDCLPASPPCTGSACSSDGIIMNEQVGVTTKMLPRTGREQSSLQRAPGARSAARCLASVMGVAPETGGRRILQHTKNSRCVTTAW